MRRVTVTPRPLCTPVIPQIPWGKWCADLCQTYPCTRFSMDLLPLIWTYCHWLLLEQGTGVGPASTPWKGVVRPFNYPCIYTAYAANLLSNALMRLLSFATIRAFPPFFVSLLNLSKYTAYLTCFSISIILNFLIMIYSLLSKFFIAEASRRNLAPQTLFSMALIKDKLPNNIRRLLEPTALIDHGAAFYNGNVPQPVLHNKRFQ